MSHPLLNPHQLPVHESLESLERAAAAEPHGRFALALAYDEGLRADGPAVLASSSALTHVGALSIQASGLDPKNLKTLLKSKYLDHVEALDLRDNFFHDTGVKVLAAWAPLANVTHLALPMTAVSSKGLATLAASPHVGALRHVDLSQNNIKGASGITALAAIADQLECWNLWGNDLGDAGVKAIAASSLMRTRRTLNLCSVMMKKAGLKALLESPHLSHVEELDISANHGLGDDGLALIAKSRALGGLRSLDLAGTGMTDAAAEQLASSAVLESLEVLRVNRSGGLSDRGIAALRASPHLRPEALKIQAAD